MKLRLKDVHKKYNDLEVLKGISFDVHDHEILCILGPSGCGKSTILRIIADLESDCTGQVERNFNNLGYVFQEDRLLKWRNVVKNISIVNEVYDSEKMKELIKLMNLQGFEDALPNTLSGGMRQRVSIARAFYYGGDVLLMDEPLKSLDYDLKFDLISSILKVHRKNTSSIVYVTHDIDEALLLGNRILILDSRPARIVEELVLETSQETRTLDSQESVHIRAAIIKNLVKRVRE